MDNRKWEADAIASPPTQPASPSNGYPTNGDPLAAQNATEPGDWWFHAIGEEIRAVIVDGGLTPNIANLTQLRDAIRNIAKGGDYKASVRVASTVAINLNAPGANIDGIAMVAGDRFLEKDHGTPASRGIYIWNGAAVAATRASDADDGTELNGGAIIPVEQGTVNADTNWQITTDGIVTIGVTGLAFQKVGDQVFASNAEAQALAVSTKAITPATLAAAFQGANQSFAASGYQKLPGGLILQWGSTANIAAGSTLNLVYPIAFPTACRAFIPLANNVTAGVYQFTTNTRTASSVNIVAYVSNNAGGTGVDWFAIGY